MINKNLGYNLLASWALLVLFAAPAFSQVARPSDRGEDHDMVYRGEQRGHWGGLPTTSLQPISESPTVKFNTNAIPYRWGLGFLSGAARGLNQVVAFHPDRFFARYPNANRQYWDNSISWRNKHKNGDPQQGPAFPFSRTALAFTTDAFHLTGTTSNVTGVVSLSIPLYAGSGKKLRHYAAEAGFSAIGYWMGFHGVYTLYFH
jgi:hypothetical protein